jgi:hypothetical protein
MEGAPRIEGELDVLETEIRKAVREAVLVVPVESAPAPEMVREVPQTPEVRESLDTRAHTVHTPRPDTPPGSMASDGWELSMAMVGVLVGRILWRIGQGILVGVAGATVIATGAALMYSGWMFTQTILAYTVMNPVFWGVAAVIGSGIVVWQLTQAASRIWNRWSAIAKERAQEAAEDAADKAYWEAQAAEAKAEADAAAERERLQTIENELNESAVGFEELKDGGFLQKSWDVKPYIWKTTHKTITRDGKTYKLKNFYVPKAKVPILERALYTPKLTAVFVHKRIVSRNGRVREEDVEESFSGEEIAKFLNPDADAAG